MYTGHVYFIYHLRFFGFTLRSWEVWRPDVWAKMWMGIRLRPDQSVFGGELMVFTLLGTNISFSQGMFEDDFPFAKVRYVSSLEGSYF